MSAFLSSHSRTSRSNSSALKRRLAALVVLLSMCTTGCTLCGPPKDWFSCLDRHCFLPDWMNAHSCVNRSCYGDYSCVEAVGDCCGNNGCACPNCQ